MLGNIYKKFYNSKYFCTRIWSEHAIHITEHNVWALCFESLILLAQ